MTETTTAHKPKPHGKFSDKLTQGTLLVHSLGEVQIPFQHQMCKTGFWPLWSFWPVCKVLDEHVKVACKWAMPEKLSPNSSNTFTAAWQLWAWSLLLWLHPDFLGVEPQGSPDASIIQMLRQECWSGWSSEVPSNPNNPVSSVEMCTGIETKPASADVLFLL